MKLFSYILLLLFSSNIYSQNINTLVAEAAKLESSLDEKGAYEKYRQAYKLQPDNIAVLNKCSELCSRIGKRESNTSTRHGYYQNAKNYAEAALKIQPENGEANCVMAIALGCVALDASSREKVNAAKSIKKYLDKALQYDPSNFKAWHVLGRWHYELSELNMFERAAIKILFGGLPSSSFDQAITAFEKANTIKAFAANNFEMARAYTKKGDRKKAIASLEALLQMPNTTEDDEPLKASARRLLAEWK